MPKNKKIQVLNNCSNVAARFLKYFGTSILTLFTLERFAVFKTLENGSIDCIICANLAGVAGIIESLNIIYNHSKKTEKIYKALLKSERFLDFIMLFRTLYKASYFFADEQYLAIAVSGGITLPFALWRSYKSKRYWIENPITLLLSKKLGQNCELNYLPSQRSSFHRFSLHEFSEFKRMYNATTDMEMISQQQNDAKILREYFNTQIAHHNFFNRYVLMDALSYGAEIAGIVGYVMFTIDTLSQKSNPMLNFGISLFLFLAGTLAGYRIEKIKDLLLSIYMSDFTRDQGLQDSIHELLLDLYSGVTKSIRYFAKGAEFFKNALASFIGLQFVYVAISGGTEVDDYYTYLVSLFSALVGINSIYNVQRQQDEMLLQTGAKTALEKLESRRSGAIVERELVLSAASDQVAVAIIPEKDEKGKEKEVVTEQLFVKSDDSSESSANSSDSGSPPKSKSLPADSPPQSSSPEADLRMLPRSAPTVDDILVESQRNDVSEPQTREKSESRGWLDGWLKFGFLSHKRSERVESLMTPLVQKGIDLELTGGALKPA